MRITAISVCGSSPTTSAGSRRPSVKTTSNRAAPCTTWLLVRMYPLVVKMKPDPPPLGLRSIFTTLGRIRRTASVTASEYASNKEASEEVVGFMVPTRTWFTTTKFRIDGGCKRLRGCGLRG